MGKRKIGKYPQGFRRRAVERMQCCDSVKELAEELGVGRTALYQWRDQMTRDKLIQRQTEQEAEETRLERENRQLKAALADKTLEVDFFKGALQKVAARRQGESAAGEKASTPKIRELMSVQGKLGIERMCELAEVSRAGFYRWLQVEQPVEEESEVRSNIQKIFLENKRRYGYRRVSKELRDRGMRVNRKRVARLMRQDNLLAVQPPAFVSTTDSDPELEVHLNLAGRMRLTGIDQLWIADITYIRLQGEYVYLAVILDAFSRRVVGSNAAIASRAVSVRPSSQH